MLRLDLLSGALLALMTIILPFGLTSSGGPEIWGQELTGAQEIPGPEPRRPLDLPSGGLGQDDDEEDAPEIIAFYGDLYEGDAFFWCLDKSASMYGPPLLALQGEVQRAVGQLTAASEFALVAFSSNVTTWHEFPVTATAARRQSAQAWVSGLEASGATCLGDGVVRTLEISHHSRPLQKTVIVVSDGSPWCNNTDTSEADLQAIALANYQATPIHTVFIGDDPGGMEFMMELASQNQGQFRLVETP